MVARSEADRWAVITHTNSGKSIAQIVRLTGFTWDFVSRWAGRAKANQGGHDKPRAGRPKSITTPMVAKIKKTIKKDQQSIRSVARTVGVSRESVRRISRANLYPYHQPARPMLTEEHKRRRRKFARDYAGFDWRRTVSFTDEKWFSLSPRGNSKNDVVWRENASLVPPKRRVAFAPRFMVWGAITYNGVGPIVRIEGNINALSYQATLAGALPGIQARLGKDGWCLLQDGAKPHAAKSTQTWLAENVPSFIPKEDWPPNSCDANCLENMWSILDTNVHRRQPRNKEELWRFVQEEWAAIPLATIRKLIDSQPSRLAAIRRAWGGDTTY